MSTRARREPSLPEVPAGISPAVSAAIEAAQSKKAFGVTLLDLREMGTFTDAFVVCSGASTRQVQAITEAVEEALEGRGKRLWHREGCERGEWVLLDYGFFIAHIFHEKARAFYDLERLWRAAKRVDFPDADAIGGHAPARGEASSE